MSGRFNNRILLIVLLLLAGIFVITRFTGIKKSGRTLNTDIVQIDTANLTGVHLVQNSAAGGEELVFTKEGTEWKVSNGQQTVPVDEAALRSAFAELLNLKTDQLVARTEDKWSGFHVNDSLGTRLTVKEGKKTTLDLVIGRFDYKPVQSPYGGYGQNRGTGITYVRNYHEDEVYAVQGFLAMTFNRDFNSWRDQTVTRLVLSRLSRIVFDYPADSGFIAQKTGEGWMVGGILADSAAMDSYLNSVSRKRSASFMDNPEMASPPDYRVTFEGDNMQPLEVEAFIRPDDATILHSSINPESWFEVPREGLFSDLFKNAGFFLSGDRQEPVSSRQ
ncbi:MAG: DUF4340 domain-containing protein [Bacteroidales bacterium]|nr:DUF4340 domain-containing protein [Bacteroidales bacterium]MBN2699617.1 DUF4340 domain-containing protein [Bacteroidales bacterium]